MGKRSRFRRAVKWIGASASVAVLLLWVASCFWQAMFMWAGKIWWWDATCDWGTLTLSWYPSDVSFAPPRGTRTGLYLVGHAWLAEHTTVTPHSPADREYYGLVFPKLVTRTGAEMRSKTAGIGVLWMRVPLWLLLLLAGVPTAFFFWRDRRKPPGHCPRCGYNLTGNLSGRCPECGAEIVRT